MNLPLSRLNLGDFTVSWLRGGTFSIDGGAMFGAVPKVLWSEKIDADNDNAILLDNNVMLVQTGKNNIIIDTGLGNKLTEKQQTIFKVSSPWLLPDDLETLGLATKDIDTVILTHCDFDHAGGAVMLDDNGHEVPTFPNAKYVVQKDEWQDVHNTTKRSANTYWPVNFAALSENQVTVIEGAYEITSGINVLQTGGHTRGHQIVEIKSQGSTAVHLGDLLPTTHHRNPLWVMAFDNYPLDAIEEKERLIRFYSDQNAWFLFYHDIDCNACRLSADYQVTDVL